MVAVVGLGLIVVFLRFTFGGFQRPDFHNYGVVHTSVGVAAVVCGGEAGARCGDGSTIVFSSCSPRYHAYFDASDGDDDRLVRALIGKRPPSGDYWTVGCRGNDDVLTRGRPSARLDPG